MIRIIDFLRLLDLKDKIIFGLIDANGRVSNPSTPFTVEQIILNQYKINIKLNLIETINKDISCAKISKLGYGLDYSYCLYLNYEEVVSK